VETRYGEFSSAAELGSRGVLDNIAACLENAQQYQRKTTLAIVLALEALASIGRNSLRLF